MTFDVQHIATPGADAIEAAAAVPATARIRHHFG